MGSDSIKILKSESNAAATFRLSKPLLSRLDAYSASTGVSKSFAVEAALSAYLTAYDDNARMTALGTGGDGKDGK